MRCSVLGDIGRCRIFSCFALMSCYKHKQTHTYEWRHAYLCFGSCDWCDVSNRLTVIRSSFVITRRCSLLTSKGARLAGSSKSKGNNHTISRGEHLPLREELSFYNTAREFIYSANYLTADVKWQMQACHHIHVVAAWRQPLSLSTCTLQSCPAQTFVALRHFLAVGKWVVMAVHFIQVFQNNSNINFLSIIKLKQTEPFRFLVNF